MSNILAKRAGDVLGGLSIPIHPPLRYSYGSEIDLGKVTCHLLSDYHVGYVGYVGWETSFVAPTVFPFRNVVIHSSTLLPSLDGSEDPSTHRGELLRYLARRFFGQLQRLAGGSRQ